MKSVFLAVILSLASLVSGDVGNGPREEPQDVRRLERLLASSQPSEMLNEDDARFLARTVTSKTSGFASRIEAMELLGQKAGAAESAVALETIKALAEEMRDDSLREDRRHVETEAILSGFFRTDAAVLAKKLPDPAPVFALAASMAQDKALRRIWPEVFQFIASGPAPVATRRRYMLEAINALPAWERAPDEFQELVTPALFGELRKVAFESTPKDQPAHGPSLDLLVEAGDAASLPFLKERAESLGKTKEYNQPGAGFIWRIEAQQDTAMLLDFISSDLWVGFAGSRSWALNKAVELGVEKERIRSAIIAFADHIDNNQWFRPELIGLKREAIRLGVFQGDELPEVKVPKLQTRPDA